MVTGIGDPQVLEGVTRRTRLTGAAWGPIEFAVTPRHVCTCGMPQWSVYPTPCPIHSYGFRTWREAPIEASSATPVQPRRFPDRILPLPTPNERPDGEAMRSEDV